MRMRYQDPQINEIHGNFKVLSFSHLTASRDKIYNVECSKCGATTRKSKSRLVHGENLFCLRCRGNSKGKAGFNVLLDNYRRSSRGFDLTEEEFLQITSSICYYCSEPPSRVVRGRDAQSDWGDYTYNGVDRKDNNKGYYVENCVPCCHWCNRAKKDYSFEEYEFHMKSMQKRLREGILCK